MTIDNKDLSFRVEDFVESLVNLQQFAANEIKLPLREALASGKFVRADLGVFRNSDDHSVWQLEKGDDGKDYIIRTDSFDKANASDWTASANRVGDSVTLAYKNYPIRRFAKAEFEYSDANEFAKFLVQKASQGGEAFVKGLVKTLPFNERIVAQKKFKIFREG